MPVTTALSDCKPTEEGIYRIRFEDEDTHPFLFIGQGKIKQRLASYCISQETIKQRLAGGEKRKVACSWVTGTWYPHQRLALVTDLIAAYLLTVGELPQEQFLTHHQTVMAQAAIFSTLTTLLLA